MSLSHIKNPVLRRAAVIAVLPPLVLVVIPAVAIFWSMVASVAAVANSWRNCCGSAWETTRDNLPRALRGAWRGQ